MGLGVESRGLRSVGRTVPARAAESAPECVALPTGLASPCIPRPLYSVPNPLGCAHSVPVVLDLHRRRHRFPLRGSDKDRRPADPVFPPRLSVPYCLEPCRPPARHLDGLFHVVGLVVFALGAHQIRPPLPISPIAIPQSHRDLRPPERAICQPLEPIAEVPRVKLHLTPTVA